MENGKVVADYSREDGEVGDIRRGEERLGLDEELAPSELSIKQTFLFNRF